MLRSRIREVLVNEKFRPLLRKIARLMIVIGIIWIFSFPYMARKVFTSENALNSDNLISAFRDDHEIFAKYKSF
jgi:hypothetical protein